MNALKAFYSLLIAIKQIYNAIQFVAASKVFEELSQL